MTVVCPSTTRPVLNDFDWVENAGILSSFIPVEKCPSVMTLDCVQKHVQSSEKRQVSRGTDNGPTLELQLSGSLNRIEPKALLQKKLITYYRLTLSQAWHTPFLQVSTTSSCADYWRNIYETNKLVAKNA
jgi:hypothetical protein